jgi:hypothetical protein
VKPIPRETAPVNLSRIVRDAKLKTTAEVVDYFIHRFMSVPPSTDARQKLVAFLDKDLGTSDISVAQTYMEQSLRLVLHLIMSQPEYQLG